LADEEKNNYSGQSNSPRNKSIDVTKPKHEPRMSNIDTSRVSDHTAREQQALEKLRKRVGAADIHAGKTSKIKTIIAIILVVILIIVLIGFFIILGQKADEPEDDTAIRVSMELVNTSVLSVVTDEGLEELRPIYPGDRLPISAYARNSEKFEGDVNTSEVIPKNVYVRFKIRFILDYQDRYEVIVPTMTSNWTKFNAELESNINNGVTEDDHYYYYCGSLPFQKRVELFSEIEFDGNKLFIEDAGKYGQIQVIVESIEANTNYLLDGVWPTAPKRWIIDMVSGRYNTNS